MTSVRLNQLGNQKWVITVELRVGSFRLRVGSWESLSKREVDSPKSAAKSDWMIGPKNITSSRLSIILLFALTCNIL